MDNDKKGQKSTTHLGKYWLPIWLESNNKQVYKENIDFQMTIFSRWKNYGLALNVKYEDLEVGCPSVEAEEALTYRYLTEGGYIWPGEVDFSIVRNQVLIEILGID